MRSSVLCSALLGIVGLVALLLCPAAVVGQAVPASASFVYTATVGVPPPPISFTQFSPNLSLSDDGVDIGCPLGFSFVFYNVSYTTVNVGANGDLQFQTSQTSFSPSTFGTGNSILTPFIAYFYTDLYPLQVGARQYATIGSAPNRQFILRLNQVGYFAVQGPPGLTMDVLLTETTNTIELRYYNVTFDGSHSVDVGIENVAVNGVYDYITVVNDVLSSSTFAASLQNTSYTFTPIVPFTNPSVFGAGTPIPPPIPGTSSVYGATQGIAPAPITFTPGGVLPYTDNGVTNVPIGFNFTFYNVSYSSVYVAANGNLQFQTAGADSSPLALGSNTNDAPFIAFFYADLLPTAAPASRTYATIGTAPNRKFILRYSNVPYQSYVGSIFATLNCDVLLSESSNNIDFRYYSAGAMVTYYYLDIGIENKGTPSDYLAILNDVALTQQQALSLTNVSYTFYPLTPFTNPTLYLGPSPPVPTTTSTVYTATGRQAPTPVAFTPAGTLPYTDNDVTYVPLGFSFVFYNVSYSAALVSANGNIQFATASTNTYPYALGTSSNSALSPLIAFFYVDLYPVAAPASRTYATIGTAPNRQFILRYYQVPLQSYISGDVLTCDVVLYESTNQIEFRYYAVPAFATTSYYLDIGIQSAAVGGVYDSVAIVNDQVLTSIASGTLANYSYLFSPIVPFVNPAVFTIGAVLTPTTTSKLYNASVATAPVAVAFTPTATLPYTDNELVYVPLGFNFTFYNVTYSSVFVAANGNLQFATASLATYPYSLGTSSNSALSPFIAFFYADLLPNAAPASRTYATIGTAPNRQFIVRYSNVALQTYISDQLLSCDVLLYEGSNAIEMRYYQVPAFINSYYVDIGIQGPLSGGSYDSVAVLNQVISTAINVQSVVGYSFTFRPINPFVNPSYYQIPALVPTTTSKFYFVNATVLAPPVAFTPTATLPYDNDGVAMAPIGFNFTFYNVSYSKLYIGSNGNIQFATASTATYPYTLGSSSNLALSPFIAFFFADLVPSAAPASRTYATLGTAPNRQFILRYSQVPLQTYISSQTLSCDVLLYETTNQIEFRYYQVPTFLSTGYYVDVGIQNAAISSTYDSVAVLSQKSLALTLSLPLNGSDWVFTPLNNFVNPTLFVGDRPPVPVVSTSTVYTAALGSAPLPPVTFTPAATLSYVDDGFDTVPLGFNFTFYNVTYSTAYVSSNGNIQFSSISTSASPAAFGSGNSALAPFIAFFWANLYPVTAPASRTYATIGTAPNRQFILRFANVPLQSYISTQLLSCDVLLYETTNQIEFRYYAIPAFLTTSYYVDIGIQNSVSNNVYDSVSIISFLPLSPVLAPNFPNASYIFTPIVSFAGARIYTPTPVPQSSSSVYTASYTNGLPTPPVFTPAGSLPSDDNGVVSVPLGFTFAFYGVAYTSVFVGSNGDIQFQTEFEDYSPGTFGTGLATLSPIIAFFYADLNPSLGGTRTYATIGTAPNRQFILRYTNVPTSVSISSTATLSCDVILTESSNTIEFRYYAVPLFTSTAYFVDIGIENGLGTAAVNDWIAVVNHQSISAILTIGLNRTSYVFTPITPFVGAAPYAAVPPTIKSNSSVYTLTTSTVPAMVSLGAGVTVLPNVADTVAQVTVGFDFVFYGVVYSTVFAGANGNLQFQTGSNTAIPTTFEAGNTLLGPYVAFYFTDLLPSTNFSRYYATIGTAPNRQLVIRYSAVPFQIAPAFAAVSCDIVLTETSNTIELRYYSVSPTPFSTTLATVGITSGTKADFISIVDAAALTAPAALGLQGNSFLFAPIVRFQANPPVFVPPPFTVIDNSTSYYVRLIPSVVPPVAFTPTTSPALSLLDDGVDLGIPLGFPFVFYGVTYTVVNIGTNGDIQFVTSSTSLSPGLFGSANVGLTPLIAFYWTDLYPTTAGSRTYGTTGTAPNRQWILRLNDVPYFGGNIAYTGLTADIVFTETTNTIEMRYYTVPSDTSHSVDIGLENSGSGSTDWLAFYNDKVMDGLHAAQLAGSTVTYYPAAACAPNCPYNAPVATGNLCLVMYSLPGNIDYPFSIATYVTFTYLPSATVTNAQGTAISILSGSGTRVFTNRFGVTHTTTLTIAASGANDADNLLYLGSAFPVDSRGLTWNLSSPVQLPGAGPQALTSLINVFNNTGVIFEYGVSRVDGLGSAWLSNVPGFMNVTIGAGNINALAAQYATCSAPITFTNGLRTPTQPTVFNGATRFSFSYFVSDGATYTVVANLTFTASSAFATPQDLLGNPYQIITGITGTRTYTYLPLNQQVVSQVTGLSNASFPYTDQRFYPYALLAAAPGVYTMNVAPFLDQDGVEFSISPPAPASGAAPGSTVQYSAISLFNTAPEPNAVLVDGFATALPLYSLQQQSYALLAP